VLAFPNQPLSPASVTAGAKVFALITGNKAAMPAELDPLFADLDPILVPDVLGIYAGGLFCGKLVCITTWAGKQFANELSVNPMLEYPSATDHSVIYVNAAVVAQMHNIEAYGMT
jgi:hypothetical protein